MAVTSKRERALQVVLVVLGLGTAVANIYPLVTSLLALRPTGGTTAPMFYTILATLGVFLVLAARDPSAHRRLIAYAVWSSFAHTAVMALMATQLPTRRGELLAVREVGDDATAARLARLRVPQHATVRRVEPVQLAAQVGGEHDAAGGRRDAGEDRMRGGVLPADLAALGIEGRDPPLGLIG